jgi:hypothetical protein
VIAYVPMQKVRRRPIHFERFGPLYRKGLLGVSPIAQLASTTGAISAQIAVFLWAQPLLIASSMTKTITLSLAFAIVAGSIAFLHRPVTHASERSGFSDTTCGDQYNALVSKAKQSLARGDRAAAIGGLVQAQSQLRHCEELQERNAKEPSSVALNTF